MRLLQISVRGSRFPACAACCCSGGQAREVTPEADPPPSRAYCALFCSTQADCVIAGAAGEAAERGGAAKRPAHRSCCCRSPSTAPPALPTVIAASSSGRCALASPRYSCFFDSSRAEEARTAAGPPRRQAHGGCSPTVLPIKQSAQAGALHLCSRMNKLAVKARFCALRVGQACPCGEVKHRSCPFPSFPYYRLSSSQAFLGVAAPHHHVVRISERRLVAGGGHGGVPGVV